MGMDQLTQECRLQYKGGFRRGDLVASAALLAAKWMAGAPLAISASGLIAGTASGTPADNTTLCIVEDSYAYYQTSGLKVMGAAVTGSTHLKTFHGSNTLRFFKCVDYDGAGTDGYAFLQTPTSGSWAVGDKVYLTATDGPTAEKWDNTVINTEAHYGVVTEVFGTATKADGIEVEFNNLAR